MIGDHAEFASFTKEQIPMNEMTETSIVQKIIMLADKYGIPKTIC